MQSTLAQAYRPSVHVLPARYLLTPSADLYNAFLAPNSPCELNIDHSLRSSLALCMIRPLDDDAVMLTNLREVVQLFELAQAQVYKLMSTVRRRVLAHPKPDADQITGFGAQVCPRSQICSCVT